MRAFVDASVYDISQATTSLKSFRQNLDYAWEHHLTEGFLPIHLIDGWEGTTVTKGFHQMAFASELAMLAVWQFRQEQLVGITNPQPSALNSIPSILYDLSGIPSQPPLHRGLYVMNGRKIVIK